MWSVPVSRLSLSVNGERRERSSSVQPLMCGLNSLGAPIDAVGLTEEALKPDLAESHEFVVGR